MSLINRMLQDLEKRNASAGRTAPLSGEVRAVAASQSTRWWPVVALGAVLAIALAVAVWMFFNRTVPAAAVVVAPPASPVQTAPAAAVPPAPVAPVEQAVAELQSVPSPEAENTGVARRLPGLDMRLMLPPQPPAMSQADKSAPAGERVPESPAAVRPAENVAQAKPAIKGPAGAASSALKTTSASQQSDNLYRQAVSTLQQGRVAEAQDMLRKALDLNPRNLNARQVLVGLMVEAGHQEEAVALLKEGLKISPEQTGFSMALARLQVETGDVKAAISVLEQALPFAGDHAEYQGFFAALLQRQDRHDEAVQHYLVALKTDPAMPTWLIGIGISLQQLGKTTDATAAFQRARDTGQLTPQLSQFVDQRLRQLKH